MSVMKEFKAFALKGNVVDLAVAVVIGGAFGKIVSALVADLIMPLVGAVLPGNEWRSFTVSSLNLKLGDFLGAVLDFFIIAAVLFIVVVKFMGAFKKKEPDVTKTCPECLETIPAAARKCKACASVVAALLLALFASTARADDPKYEYRDPSAPPAVAAAKPTVWKANLTLGLTYVGGNAQSIGVSGTGLVGVKHYNNEWTLNGGGAYVNAGTSKYGKGGPVTDELIAAANWLVKGRYDRYFFEKNTVFVSFQSQGDEPAGYKYRLEPQVGYARALFKSVHQFFRGEIGYDYTFEHRVPQPTDAMGNTPPRNVQYHSGRLYLFYENKFTQYATFSEGLELLEAFNKLEGFRLNSLTSLSSQLYKNVALKVNFTLKFNNDPALRPAPTGVDPVTMMPFVYAPEDAHFQKLDMQLDVVLAVTII